MRILNWAKQIATSRSTINELEGLYHFEKSWEDERARIHLRVCSDSSGTIIVNANRIYHLNPTATWMAYGYLSEKPEAWTVEKLIKRYNVPKSTASIDYAHFCHNLESLIMPEGACPICDLDLEINPPFSNRPQAPYRMDLALTYRCNNDCLHCYNVSTRDDPELSTQTWMQILDKLWEAGIPHIVFTGGEPTLRDDLPDLIAYAEAKGMITGVNTNGRRLSDQKFVTRLVEAGLDHIQITLESHNAEIHDRMVMCKGAWKQTVSGIRNVLQTPLYVMTNTTMLSDNAFSLAETLDFLVHLGVPTVGLNALIHSGRGAAVGTGLAESQLPQLLSLARQKTDAAQQKLIWYTPTQYCHFDPVQMELGVKGCTAALYNMCIEPDGAVLPCQSYYHPIGNILRDDWRSIWEHELCVWLRERQYVPETCNQCTLLAVCGGGCPLKLDNQHQPQFLPVSAVDVSTFL